MKEFSEGNNDQAAESGEYNMEDFRQEIQGLIDENTKLASERKKYNPHFYNPRFQIKAEHLQEADKEVFVRFKKAITTMDDADIKSFYEALKDIESKKSVDDMSEEEKSRMNLYGYLVNEGMTFYLAKMEKERREKW